MVSVIFSNDIGFCLNTILPFFISTPLCFVGSPAGKLPVVSVPRDEDRGCLLVGGGGLSVSEHESTRP
jgi:hypothetical protein